MKLVGWVGDTRDCRGQWIQVAVSFGCRARRGSGDEAGGVEFWVGGLLPMGRARAPGRLSERLAPRSGVCVSVLDVFSVKRSGTSSCEMG